jgi:hypothetical protein
MEEVVSCRSNAFKTAGPFIQFLGYILSEFGVVAFHGLLLEKLSSSSRKTKEKRRLIYCVL